MKKNNPHQGRRIEVQLSNVPYAEAEKSKDQTGKQSSACPVESSILWMRQEKIWEQQIAGIASTIVLICIVGALKKTV